MAENSNIEWTDHTFNPWRGCSKVSAGCTNCYADRQSKRNPQTLGIWGPNGTRIVASEAQWKKPLQWNAKAKAAQTRVKVFCASLGDVFEDWNGPMVDHLGDQIVVCHGCGAFESAVETHYGCRCRTLQAERVPRPCTMDDVRKRLFELIDATPCLDWILVTKRPENIRKFWTARDCDTCGGFGVVQTWCGNVATSLQQTADDCPECSVIDMEFRPNVWLLTSVENQEQADQRIPELVKCRDLSPVLGLSCEPLLGPLNLERVTTSRFTTEHGGKRSRVYNLLRLLDWIIAGGESGPNARPMHPDWARSLRDQCQAAEVPFFFKQWGEWLPVGQGEPPADWTNEKKYPSQTVAGQTWLKVGKKQAGRLLDGREWSEFPEINTSVAGR